MICRTSHIVRWGAHVSTMPQYFDFGSVGGEGTSLKLRQTAWSIFRRTICAEPPSFRPFRPIAKSAASISQISRYAFTFTAASSICLNWLGLWFGETGAIITAHTKLTLVALKIPSGTATINGCVTPISLSKRLVGGAAQTMEDSSRLFLALHRREFVRRVHSNVLADSMNDEIDEIAGNLLSYRSEAFVSPPRWLE